MFRVELGKAVRRWRTWALAAALGGIPILIVIGVSLSRHPRSQEGPPFLALILKSGFFAPLTSLAVLQPFFLPLTASLLAGDAIAGEASAGTLRYLLARPVGRRRLLIEKYLSVMALVGLGTLWVVVVGTIAGGIAFGFGVLPTLSGTLIGAGAAIVRILGAAAYVTAGVASLAAIGLFISTLTESAPGATVATVVFAIVSQILDAIGNLRVIHPYLLSHDWPAFADLMRDPVAWHRIIHGLTVDAAYVAIFGVAALIVFGRKDITA
jgi:ABC-2 type transport system permease protein